MVSFFLLSVSGGCILLSVKHGRMCHFNVMTDPAYSCSWACYRTTLFRHWQCFIEKWCDKMQMPLYSLDRASAEPYIMLLRCINITSDCTHKNPTLCRLGELLLSSTWLFHIKRYTGFYAISLSTVSLTLPGHLSPGLTPYPMCSFHQAAEDSSFTAESRAPING